MNFSFSSFSQMSFLESTTDPETQSKIIVREFKDPFCFSNSTESNNHHKSNLIPSRNKWSSTTSSFDSSSDINKRRSSSRLSSSSDLDKNNKTTSSSTRETSCSPTKITSPSNNISTNNTKTSTSTSPLSTTDQRKSSCTTSFDELLNGKDEINTINEQDKPLLRLWAQKNKTNAALSSSSHNNRNSKSFPGPSNDSKKFLNQLSSTPWGKFLKSNNSNMPSKSETRKSDNIIISTRATVKKDSISSCNNNGSKITRPKSAYYERNLLRAKDGTTTKGLNVDNNNKDTSIKQSNELTAERSSFDDETKEINNSTKRPSSRIFVHSKSEASSSDYFPSTTNTNNGNVEFHNHHQEKNDSTKERSDSFFEWNHPSTDESSQAGNDPQTSKSTTHSNNNNTDEDTSRTTTAGERAPPVPKRSTSRSKELVGYIRKQRNEQDDTGKSTPTTDTNSSMSGGKPFFTCNNTDSNDNIINNRGDSRLLMSNDSLHKRSVKYDSPSDRNEINNSITLVSQNILSTNHDRYNCNDNKDDVQNDGQDETRNRVPLTNCQINNITNNGSHSNYTVNSWFASSSHITNNKNDNKSADGFVENNTILTADNTKTKSTNKTRTVNPTSTADNTKIIPTTTNCSAFINNTDNNKTTSSSSIKNFSSEVHEKSHCDSNNNISLTSPTKITERVDQLQQQQPLRYQKRDKSFNFSRKVRQQKARSFSLFEFPSSVDHPNKDPPVTADNRGVLGKAINTTNDKHNDNGDTNHQRRTTFTGRRDDRRRSVDFSRLVSAKPWKSNLIQQKDQKTSLSSSSILTTSTKEKGETVPTSTKGGETIGAHLYDGSVERKQGIQQKNYHNQQQQQRHQREIIIPQTFTRSADNTVLVRKEIDIDISDDKRPASTCLTNKARNHEEQRNNTKNSSNSGGFLLRQQRENKNDKKTQNHNISRLNPYTDIESQITGIHLSQQDQLNQQKQHRSNNIKAGISLLSTSLGGLGEAHTTPIGKKEEKIAFAFRPRSKSQPELFFENETKTNIFSSTGRKLGTEQQPCDAENHKQISYSLNSSIQQQNGTSSSSRDNIVNGDDNISINEMGSKYYTSNDRSLNSYYDHQQQQDSVFKTSSSLSTNLSHYNNESANMSDKYSRRKSFSSNEQHSVHKNRYERSYSLNEDYDSQPISTKTSRTSNTSVRRSSEHDISGSLISSSYVPKSAYLRQRLLELQSGNRISTKDNQRSRRSRENSISSSEDSHSSLGSFSKNSKKNEDKIDAFIRNHKERRSIEKTHSNSSSSSSFHSTSPPYSPVKIVNKSTNKTADIAVDSLPSKNLESSLINQNSSTLLANKSSSNIPDDLSERLSKTCQEILEQHQFHNSSPPPDTSETNKNLDQEEDSVFSIDTKTTTKTTTVSPNNQNLSKPTKSPEMESVFGRRGSLKDMKDAVVRRFASSSNSESKKSNKEKDDEILADIQESPFDKSLVMPKSSSTEKVTATSVKSTATVKVTTKNRFGKEKSSSTFGSITKITSSKISAASDLKGFSIKKKSKAESSKFDFYCIYTFNTDFSNCNYCTQSL